MQKNENITLAVLAISLCIFSVLTYYFNIFCRFDQLIILRQEGIINGTSSLPNKYRLLAPYLSHYLSVLCQNVFSRPALGFNFMFTMVIFISYTWFAFFQFIKLVFKEKKDIMIAFFVFAVFLTAGMNHHSYQPWSYLEAGLFLTGVAMVKRNKTGIFFFLLCMITILNRETGIFLALIPAFHKINKKNIFSKEMLECYIFIIGSIAAFISIRLLIGNDTKMESIGDIFLTNLEPMNLVLLLPVLISGLIFFLLKNNEAAAPLKNSMYLFLLYLIPALLFGRWIEIRVLLPFSYLLVPVITNNLVRISGTKS